MTITLDDIKAKAIKRLGDGYEVTSMKRILILIRALELACVYVNRMEPWADTFTLNPDYWLQLAQEESNEK